MVPPFHLYQPRAQKQASPPAQNSVPNQKLAEAREFMNMYFKKEPKVFADIKQRQRMAVVRHEIARLERIFFGKSAKQYLAMQLSRT
jgi:hypothetical protein